MAIIYSYPETLELLPTDMLIGTSTIRVAGKKKNITKNFTLELLKNFVLEGVPIGDKTYVYVQATAATTWNIQHNLDKFPSVSVVNINNILMYGQVTYIDLNNLIIEFSAGFSGKAYMN